MWKFSRKGKRQYYEITRTEIFKQLETLVKINLRKRFENWLYKKRHFIGIERTVKLKK